MHFKDEEKKKAQRSSDGPMITELMSGARDGIQVCLSGSITHVPKHGTVPLS